MSKIDFNQASDRGNPSDLSLASLEQFCGMSNGLVQAPTPGMDVAPASTL